MIIYAKKDIHRKTSKEMLFSHNHAKNIIEVSN